MGAQDKPDGSMWQVPADTRVINQSELNRLAQEIHDLREALRPFAIFAEALPPIIDNQPRITDDGVILAASPAGRTYKVTCTELRRAKTLLDSLEAQDVVRVDTDDVTKYLGEEGDGD